MKEKLFFCISSCLVSFVFFGSCVAQTIGFGGQVLDAQGDPIAEAQVMVDEIPYLGAVTDADGRFILEFEESDVGREVRIRIETSGHEIWYRDITIGGDMRPLGSITLQETPQAPRLISPENEVTVYDPRPTFRWESVQGYTYNLQVDDHSNFLDPEINEDALHSSTHKLTIRLGDGIYHWRVQTRKKGTGIYSEWSEPWIVATGYFKQQKGVRNRNAAFRSLLIPGWGQKYKSRNRWEWGLMVGSYGLSIIGAVIADRIQDKEYDTYLKARSVNKLEDAYDRANQAHRIRNRLLIAIPTIAVCSAIHAYFSEDTQFQEDLRAGIQYNPGIQNGEVRLVFMKSF